MIIALLLLKNVFASIKYDTNIFKKFDNTIDPSFQCQENLIQYPVSFSQSFSQIPKVFLTIEKFYIETNVNYQVSVSSITLIDFVINLDCPTKSNVIKLWIKWYAIDSPHLEIINCFDSSCPLAQEYQFTHNVPYALYGFISLTSFQSTGPVDFVMTIPSITETTVTTQLSSIANLISIGYQIILSFKAAIVGYYENQTTSPYINTNIPTETNQYFLVLFSGFTYPNENNFSLEVTVNLYPTINRAQYRVGYSYQVYDKYVANTHFYIQIPYLFTDFGQIFKINHLNIRSIYDVNHYSHSNIELYLEQVSRLYSEVGVHNFTSKVSLFTLNMNVYLKCTKQCRFKSIFNYCEDCLNQKPYEQTKQINGGLTTMKYFPRFTSNQKAIKNLRITITTTSLEVIQIAYTEIAQIQKMILLIEIQNL